MLQNIVVNAQINNLNKKIIPLKNILIINLYYNKIKKIYFNTYEIYHIQSYLLDQNVYYSLNIK